MDISTIDRATARRSLLVLGGTSFIGRNFCELLLSQAPAPVVLLNRKRTNPSAFPSTPRLVCDRNNADECKAQLAGYHWDRIVDFSGQQDPQIRNVLDSCTCNHYTFFSSSAVDRSWPSDPLFAMAQNKLWCEHLVQSKVKNVLVVRPGFVCGRYDYTNRFEEIDGMWVWKGTSNPVHPMVRVDFLCSTLLYLVQQRTCGVFRAGYVA
jgi:nucleoside-diphosphate-sugar epimerase